VKKSAKKNNITISQRNVHILLTLTRGPITAAELKERCFKKDQAVDYTAFRMEQERSVVKPRDNDLFISRQVISRKLIKIQNKGLISSFEHFEMTEEGMPIQEKIYFLTELGLHHVSRSYGISKHNIRYGKPLEIHVSHELNLSRIIRKIYDDAESGKYRVNYAHGDRALRSIFCRRLGHLPAEGELFLDLHVELMCNSGNLLRLPLELANLKDDPDFWEHKIKNIQETFFIIARTDDFASTIVKWILKIKPGYEMFVVSLPDFLKLGVANTVWQKVKQDSVERCRINLDI
jgi:hypothetical protein